MEFKPKFELSNSWLIEEYVTLNLGIGIVTREFIQEELNEGKFKEIKTDEYLPKREIAYAIRKNYLYNHIVEEFINTIKNIL